MHSNKSNESYDMKIVAVVEDDIDQRENYVRCTCSAGIRDSGIWK